ncbi:ComF family protein [Sphingopyxis sp. LARHCG72]
MEIRHEHLEGEDIALFGNYRPWWYHKEQGGDGSNYPLHSSRILDLKDGNARGIDYFCDYIAPRMKRYPLVAAVPSHDPEKTSSGIRVLAAKLEAAGECKNVSGLLVRHTKIQKLAAGGNRSIDVHLKSIRIDDGQPIKGQRILLIDDVLTTGYSLLACRKLLLAAGADFVKCAALGRTTY